MDYTYQNTPSEGPVIATLSEYNLTFSSSKEQSIIPYSMITEVRLMRDSEKKFKTILMLNNGRTHVISNIYFNPEKKMEDHSRPYSTFIRVLHFHLKDKSRAVFTSGNPASKTWNWLTFSVIISFLISFTAEYFGVGLVNPVIQAVVLILMMGIIILALNMGQWPKHYQPTDIPLEFLP